MFGLVPFKFNNGENNRMTSVDNMFQDFFNDDFLSPFTMNEQFKTDIKETQDEYKIQAELPGVNKEDISLEYNNNYLTVKAVRSNENESNENNFIRRERSYGEFSRSFYISNVDKNTINANFENGVLNITLPKKEKVIYEDTRIPIN